MAFNPRETFIAIRGSFWFVPALVVVACATLAVAMVQVDASLPEKFFTDFPRSFGAGAEGSRALLSAIATSTMTVAGVVFSINIVALSLAAGQYSPHVLQHFIGDRTNQTVLGIFLGIFTYCLIVLRTVRGGDDDFVPGASIVVGIALALVGVAFLIFFIHHISVSIQVSHIISQISEETRRVIERIYPDDYAPPRERDMPELDDAGIVVGQARPPGYLEQIDYGKLADIAGEVGGMLRVPVAVGDFVVPDQPLAVLHGAVDCDEALLDRVRAAFAIGRSRNIDQDVAFGLQQLVDIASKALSPSSNDTTTAIHALQHLTALLSMLARRDLTDRCTIVRDERVVVVCAWPGFSDFVAIAAGPLRLQARAYPSVLERLVTSLSDVGVATLGADERASVLGQLWALEETVRDAGLQRSDEAALNEKLAAASRRIAAAPHARRRGAGNGAPTG